VIVESAVAAAAAAAAVAAAAAQKNKHNGHVSTTLPQYNSIVYMTQNFSKVLTSLIV